MTETARPLLVVHCECEVGRADEPPKAGMRTVVMDPQNAPVGHGDMAVFRCPKCNRRVAVFNIGPEALPVGMP